jgi:CRISPR-associated protein Cas1
MARVVSSIRQLLNTIYVTQSDVYVHKKGETVVFEHSGQKMLQVPIHTIEGIVFYGTVTVTPHLMSLCSERNVHLSFISNTNRFLARIQNPINGNVRLRRIQYKVSDQEDKACALAKNFVIGKVFNSRMVLMRLLRDHSEKVDVTSIKVVVSRLKRSLNYIEQVNSIRTLLGHEGEAAQAYYSVFDALILNHESGFVFEGRTRRPPRDEVNAMLSFFYTILAHDVEAALETVGLDPQVGFYHQERPGRSSLALDIMEELRPYLVDRFVVSLINNQQVSKADFVYKESGTYLIEPDSKKKLLRVWQNRKQDEIQHPFLKEKIEVGLIPYVQAMLLARCLRGDLDGYPPFLMR